MKALGFVVIFGVVALACQSAGGAQTSPVIIIASDLPSSAFFSSRPLEQAIGYAIGQQPTIEGFRIGYWPLDDSLGGVHSLVRGRQNIARMVADRRVLGVVGPESSYLAVAQIPLANASHLAMVSATTTNTCLTVAASFCKPKPDALRPSGANNYFRITPRDPQQGKAMAHYAATTMGLRRVAAFSELGPEGELYLDEFVSEFAKTGGALVYRQDLPDGNTDFSAFLKAARALQAEAVYGVVSADQKGCLPAVQMQTLLPGATLMVTDAITGEASCIADAGPAAEGMLGTYTYVDPTLSTDPTVEKTIDAYRKVYPKPSDATLYTFSAYDCARILMDAIGRAIRANGGAFPSREQVVAALAQTHDHVGLTGTYAFDKNGDAIFPMMSVYKVQGGEWTYIPTRDLMA